MAIAAKGVATRRQRGHSRGGVIESREVTNMSARSQLAGFYQNTTLYQEFQAELDEIHKHKWIESQKRGRDVGFDWALMDWVLHHRRGWLKWREHLRSQAGAAPGSPA